MNARIRELAKLAEIKIKYDHDSEMDEFGEDAFCALERLAESIIHECVRIAYEYDAPKMSGPGMIIGRRIEDWFGIESDGFCPCCGARTDYQACDDSCIWG